MRAGDYVYFNKEILLYRESVSKRLVKLSWNKFIINETRRSIYLNVPIILEIAKVAHACLDNDSQAI